MVDPHLLAMFVVAAFALVLIPGPNHLYITARSVAEGRRSGVASALGIESGTLVHVLIATAGLSYVIASSAVAFDVVRYAGAAYLIYLGVRTLRSSDASTSEVPSGSRGPWRAFVEGVVVGVFNPKVILFFLAFLPQFVDPAAGPVPVQMLVLGLTLAAIGLAIDMVYAFFAGLLGTRLRGSARARARLRIGSGATYIGLGVLTAVLGARR